MDSYPFLHFQFGAVDKHSQSVHQDSTDRLNGLSVVLCFGFCDDFGTKFADILHEDRLNVRWETGHFAPQHGFYGVARVDEVPEKKDAMNI